jgi:hypothetical protein
MAINLKELNPMDFMDKDIFDILGIGEAESSKKDAMIQEMIETIQNRVVVRALDLMSEEEGGKFSALLEEGNNANIESFVEEKGIDFGKITAEESLLYKMEIINLYNNGDINKE